MSHNHNLSINSISSLIEPTTPPNIGANKSILWDSNNLNNNLNLPKFNLDQQVGVGTSPGLKGYSLGHTRQISMESNYENKENFGHGMKSKIDKEYLSSINKIPLGQLRSEILKLSKDQYGCRFLQKKIDENLIPNYPVRLANFEIIFKEIYPYLYELIIDPFGNYLIQKLINFCNEMYLNLILEILQFNLFQISINQHGTRALQKIIDNLNNSHQLSLLIKGLKPYIIELIKDLNGNHVIQKILNKYSPENCQFIYESIINDLYVVATHKHGCCVLQKCLNHVTPNQLLEFSNKILSFDIFTKLVNDQFGNYVLQYLISINSIDINRQMFNNFIKFGINDLCNLKFSSNVIEKFLKNCFKNEYKSRDFSNLKFDLTYQILISDLNKLINDPYGNYVIQTLIDILVNPSITHKEPYSEDLLLLLPLNYKNLQDSLQIIIIKNWFQNCKIVSSFGKRIQSKINTILNGTNQQQQIQQQSSKIKIKNMIGQQNMNANGEFISSDQLCQQQQPPSQLPVRSLSFSAPPLPPLQSQQRNLPLNNYFNNRLSNNYIFGSQNDSSSSSVNLSTVHNQQQPVLFNEFMINDYQLPIPPPQSVLTNNSSNQYYQLSNNSSQLPIQQSPFISQQYYHPIQSHTLYQQQNQHPSKN